MIIVKLSLLTLALLSSMPQQLDAPYSEKMLRDKASYYDQSSGYFIAVNTNQSEYMVGTVLAKLGNGDVPVDRGKAQTCDTSQVTCMKVGPYLFLNPRKGLVLGNFVSIDGYRADITKVRGGGHLVEVRCPRFAGSGCLPREANLKPDLIYKYEVGSKGEITTIRVKWNLGSTYIYHLRPVSSKLIKV